MIPCRTIKIIIADSFEIFRCGYRHIIETPPAPSFEVIAESADGINLIEQVKKLRPDIVITDIKMALLDGVKVCSIIQEKYPKTKIIVLASFEQGNELIEMIAASGANAYLIKHANKTELLNALTAVNEGIPYYCGTATKMLFETLQTSNKKEKKIPFSVQEMKVIQLICKQLTTKEIAGTLRVGNRSVEDYRRNIQEKIGARNMVGIALYALANDLIQLSDLDLF